MEGFKGGLCSGFSRIGAGDTADNKNEFMIPTDDDHGEDGGRFTGAKWEGKVTGNKSMLGVMADYLQLVANLARTANLNQAASLAASKHSQTRSIPKKNTRHIPRKDTLIKIRENANTQCDLQQENSLPFCSDLPAFPTIRPFWDPYCRSQTDKYYEEIAKSPW
jgi:hypothetical protein